MNTQEWLTLCIAVGGFLGTIALLILNTKVSAAMSKLETHVTSQLSHIQLSLELKVKGVELEVQKLRTEAAEDRGKLYERVIDQMTKGFLSRETVMSMHKENEIRLEAVDKRITDLTGMIRELQQRIMDIS
jgi:hypothetical protein